MKMDDEKLKRILQEGMEYEADCIMAEVDSDPNVKNAIAPEDLHTNLMKQIREHEDAKERERENQAKEEQELIRLGKIYKKKRARRKYIVLIAAVVCALGVGTISFGDGKKVFTEMRRILGDREQAVVNSGDEERHIDRGDVNEEEAYELIEEKFGFWAVRMYHLPDGMKFSEMIIEEESQNVRLYYESEDGKSIIYRIVTDYRTSSIGADIEDIFIREYEKNVEGTDIIIKEYEIEETKSLRWSVDFVYKDAQYTITLTGIEQEQVEETVENLYFS